jgi:hypothetical protein
MLNKKFITVVFAFIAASNLVGCTSTEDALPPTAWGKYDYVATRKYKPAKYPKDILKCYYSMRNENLEEVAQFLQAQLKKDRWYRFKFREDRAFENLMQKLPYEISFSGNGEDYPFIYFGDGVLLVKMNSENLGGNRFVRMSPDEERQLLSITGMDGRRSYSDCSKW